MDVLRGRQLLGLLACLGLTGCQIPYLISSAYEQGKILSAKKPIEKFLKDPAVKEDIKRKLVLVGQAREFAVADLGLTHSKNYTEYVELGRPYVSYLVHAAPAFKLEHYLWSFPVVGKVPYKGFFSKEKAEAEAKGFNPEQYDTYVRGVSAFSTLGWFNDPVLSSMMNYHDHDLVNTIIHETVHATLFIKGHADFNERLATFLGDEGTRAFYLKKDGAQSPALKGLEDDAHDGALFASFISIEIKSLREFYKSLAGTPDLAGKTARLSQIQEKYKTEIQPQMRTHQYDGILKDRLNNARLLAYGTYYMDQSDFELAYAKLGRDFKALLEFSKSLAKAKDPEGDLKKFAHQSP